MVQLAPGNRALGAELLSQIHSGAAVAAVETADTLFQDGAPSWLLEAALLALRAAAGEEGQASPSCQGSWVCVFTVFS